MSKKIISYIIIILIFSATAAPAVEASSLQASPGIELITDYTSEGRIGIQVSGYANSSIKVIVSKDGKMNFYDARNGITEFYPLLYG